MQPSTRPNPALWTSLLDQLGPLHDAAGHHGLIAKLWQDERWFDTPRQRAAAESLAAAMHAAGLAEARVVPFPADGRTRFQDWTTKMAWECRAAQVALDGEVLADRAQVPCATPMGSGPLPLTTAPVVDIDRLERVDRAAVAGKFVFGSASPLSLRHQVRRLGALAVLSDWIGDTVCADDDTTKWANGWSEGPGGWFLDANDESFPGFCLTRRAGRRLRAALRERPGLELTAFCDSRVYAGEGHCVTAVLPGTDPTREVWVYAHANEQGANDNTSGVATLVEMARMLRVAIDAGKLPRPRHSIRIIATEECLGMLAFASRNGDYLKRAIVGMNVDTVGDPAEPGRPHGVFFGPFSNPTVAWPIAGVFAELMQERSDFEWNVRPAYNMMGADDMIADPNCGVPSVWVGRGADGIGYHSSKDTPDCCVPLSLRCNALVAAGTAYVLADLARLWGDALLDPIAPWVKRYILPGLDDDARALRRWVAATMLRDAARWGVPSSAIEPRAARYAPAGAPPLPDLPTGGAVYRRRTWGSVQLLDAKPGERAFGCWSSYANASLYWCDGQRSVEAIDRLAKAELYGFFMAGLRSINAERVFDSCVAAGVAERVR